MRKFISFALVLLCLLCLVACKSQNEDESKVAVKSQNTEESKTAVKPQNSDKSKFVVVENEDDLVGFYMGALRISQNDSISKIEVVDESGESGDFVVNAEYDNRAFDGKTIYCLYYDSLYKLTLDGDKLIYSEWVSEDTLKNSCIGEIYKNHSLIFITDFQYYDNYIYCYTDVTLSYSSCLSDSEKQAYKLVRISDDGEEISFVNDIDITTSSFTISDGWIYYYDNGYVYENNNYSIDTDKVGLYKIRVDGKDKLKLYGDFEQQDNYKLNSNGKYNLLCRNIIVNDDYIYFVDHSKNGKGKVCRISLDGSDYEVISQNCASSFCLSDENNKLYYVNGCDEYGVSKMYNMLYECDLFNNTEAYMFNTFSPDDDLDYCGDYLYIEPRNSPFTIWRYNFEERNVESIYMEENDKFVKKNGKYSYAEGDATYYWKEEENRISK